MEATVPERLSDPLYTSLQVRCECKEENPQLPTLLPQICPKSYLRGQLGLSTQRSPCHLRPRVGELAGSSDHADGPCPSHFLMANLTVFISFPPPPLPPCLGTWLPPSWGWRYDQPLSAASLQGGALVPLAMPTVPPSLAVKPGDHLQGSSSAPGRPGETRTLTEFPASLWASRDLREPSLALRVNS